jgi:dynein heavy chain
MLQDYAYTMAAAYRSEQRRLLSFLRMADFMLCDTLQTILLASVGEMLAILQPTRLGAGAAAAAGAGCSPGSANSSSRSLQAMATMMAGSRRQRVAAAIAGMQLSPVTAAQQAAATEAAAAQAGASGAAVPGPRPPLLELEVVMSSSCDELEFTPEPEQFQVCRQVGGWVRLRDTACTGLC